MSTDFLARRPARTAGLLVALLVAGACATRASSKLPDLCTGTAVSERVTLVIDTVLTPGSTLRTLTGQRYGMTLHLTPRLTPGNCGDATGDATYDAQLPDELVAGISHTVSPTWLVEGTEVVVDFNPAMANDHLEMRLPVDGSTGHWTLSGVAGQVARGRVLPGS